MEKFPKEIKFNKTWRRYQKRILDDLEQHLEDDQLHLVAPPGSGKTLLGIEVAIRLNQPTLVMTPTLALQAQWSHALHDNFTLGHKKKPWVSTSINQPDFFTIVTYQSYHSWIEKEGNGHILAWIEKNKFGTIILDEAHHLKKNWWNSLSVLKGLTKIIALTATPPYDVTTKEWNKYIELNGPIDAEISIPELVKDGDLCPHQDYIFLSTPLENEQKKIDRFNDEVDQIAKYIIKDKNLLHDVSNSTIFLNPLENLEWIHNNIPSYFSILIFLHAQNVEIIKEHYDIIQDDNFNFPKFNTAWMETLLQEYLKNEDIFNANKTQKNLYNSMLDNIRDKTSQTINLTTPTAKANFLTKSISKLQSIAQITEFEYFQLKERLRLVILADYILPELIHSENSLNKVGAVSILKTLYTNSTFNKTAVLTGSHLIIPIDLKSHFFKTINQDLPYIQVQGAKEFIHINITDQIRKRFVSVITQFFQEGLILILIGTKALLGEGWDAPSINTLIISSSVGSFVTTNQMRGRALRKDPLQPQKSSNIWHLACIDPKDPSGGADIELIKRRFNAFLGTNILGKASIESGISRLHIPNGDIGIEHINSYNKIMLDSAASREKLADNWKQAIASGVAVFEELKIPIQSKGNVNLLEKTLLKVPIFARYRLKKEAKNIERIGIALLETLTFLGIVKSSISIRTYSTTDKFCYCHIDSESRYDRTLYTQSLEEIFNPIVNPKYLIYSRRVYYSVPSILGAKKDMAMELRKSWLKHVGQCSLVYTKTSRGRSILLKERVQHIQENKRLFTEKIRTWSN